MDQKMKARELLFRIEMVRKGAIQPSWNEMGLIAGQPRVLSELLEKDRMSQVELAQACFIEPATLSRALDKLESAGYLSRRQNPKSRRSFLICLTAKGKEAAERVREMFRLSEDRMFESFTEEELDCLIRLMGKVYINLFHEEES